MRAIVRSLACNLWSTLSVRNSVCAISISQTRGKRFLSSALNYERDFGIRRLITTAEPQVSSVKEMLKLIEDLHTFSDRSKSDHKYRPDAPPVPKSMRFWFRGQEDYSWDLLPAVHRTNKVEGGTVSYYYETPLVKLFMLTNPDDRSDNIFKILSKMQHYSYPTRLLDWTDNIMLAGYFACARNYDTDGIIWILNPFKLNLFTKISERLAGLALVDDFDVVVRTLHAIVEDNEELMADYLKFILAAKNNMFLKPCVSGGQFNGETTTNYARFCAILKEATQSGKLQSPIAVDPGNLNDRLSVQHGKFTVSGGKRYYTSPSSTNNNGTLLFSPPTSLLDVTPNKDKEEDDFIWCVRIPAKYKKKIKEELQLFLGIDDASLMLDLDHKGRVAANLYYYTKPKM